MSDTQAAAEKVLSEHALSWAGSSEFGRWECGCGETFDGHLEGTFAKGYAHPVHVAAALAEANCLRPYENPLVDDLLAGELDRQLEAARAELAQLRDHAYCNERVDRADQRTDAARAALDRVRALADEWGSVGPSLVQNACSAGDVHEGQALDRCAHDIRAALDGAQ